MTQRRLGDRVREHYPLWLELGKDGKAKSSIAEHVLTEGHYCKRGEGFEIHYRSRHPAKLKFVEAVMIRQRDPKKINKMKDLCYQLMLPWIQHEAGLILPNKSTTTD